MERILNDPVIMAKLSKGLGQMSTCLRTFSKICDLLVVKSRESNEISQSRDVLSQPIENDSDSSEPEEVHLEWNTETKKWLFSKESRWGPTHGKDLAKFAIGKKWRADSCKHFWRFVGPYHQLNPTPVQISNRENWRKVSENKVELLYQTYCNELENLKEILFNNKRKNTKLWRDLRCSKQRRVNNVINAKEISLKAFQKIMRDNHCDMPPLRGKKNN